MLSSTLQIGEKLINSLDGKLTQHSPTKLIATTVATTLAAQQAYKIYKHWDTQQIKKSLMNQTVQTLEQLPVVGPKVKEKIDQEVASILSGIKKDVDEARKEWKPIATMPQQGLSEEMIRKRFETLQRHYKPGKLSGGVYAQYDDEKFVNLLKDVWEKTALTNPMHSEWPLINLMEAEVISMVQALLHGEPGGQGIITHGGSTSILEACKAYVRLAREKGIETPEIIVPDTAHVSFDKAAHILNAKLIKIPVNPHTGAADVKAMQRAITSQTCMLVGSAPSFPFGIIDPIQALGDVAVKHKIPLHVDSCLGGFLTSFAKEAGFDIFPCDFSVPGVTSISIDTHKYGQAPKGSSILVFRKNCPASTTHVNLDWTGGMYVTPSIDGSRSGADIALVWTVLCYLGKEYYVAETRRILSLQKEIVEEIQKIPGIQVPYNPRLSVIPIQSTDEINLLLIADQLKEKKYSVNILQTPEQKANGFHFCLTSVHTKQKGFAKQFVSDLREAVKYAKAHPNEKPKGMAKAYGKLEKGVPSYIQKIIGEGFIKILNTLPGIPLFFEKPEKNVLSMQNERVDIPTFKI